MAVMLVFVECMYINSCSYDRRKLAHSEYLERNTTGKNIFYPINDWKLVGIVLRCFAVMVHEQWRKDKGSVIEVTRGPVFGGAAPTFWQ